MGLASCTCTHARGATHVDVLPPALTQPAQIRDIPPRHTPYLRTSHHEARMPRPRKSGLREPNGRPSRSDRVQYWQRQRDVLERKQHDPKLETPLGLYFLAHEITTQEHEAGQWFADLRASADAALSLPGRHCRAQDMNSVGGQSNSQETPETQKAKRRAIEQYDKVIAFVGRSRQLAALEHVIVQERRHDTYEQWLDLVQGLRLLVAYRMGRRLAA